MPNIVRIADDYFEIVDKPFINGTRQTVLKVRKLTELNRDKIKLKKVQQLKDFIVEAAASFCD